MMSEIKTIEIEGVMVDLIFSCRRSISVTVGSNKKLLVRCPMGTRDQTIHKLVKTNWSIIQERLKAVPALPKTDFSSNSTIQFRGKNLTVKESKNLLRPIEVEE